MSLVKMILTDYHLRQNLLKFSYNVTYVFTFLMRLASANHHTIAHTITTPATIKIMSYNICSLMICEAFNWPFQGQIFLMSAIASELSFSKIGMYCNIFSVQPEIRHTLGSFGGTVISP